MLGEVSADRQQFPFYVQAYYSENAVLPKLPGSLAFETKHANETSRDIEIEVARSRDDIGEVVWGYR